MLRKFGLLLSTVACAAMFGASPGFSQSPPGQPPFPPGGQGDPFMGPPFGGPMGDGGPPPPVSGGRRPVPRPARLDGIARQAGARAYLAAKLNLTPAQDKLWERVEAAA